jgi:hypothetical protein
VRIEIGPSRIELRAGAGALVVGPAGVVVEGGLQEAASAPADAPAGSADPA